MRMSSLNCIARYCIEFSSLILLLVVLLLMHGMGDATFAKQVKINSVSEKKLHFDNVKSDAFEETGPIEMPENVLRFTPDSIDFGKTQIGKPLIETVHVHNIDDEKTIQMISVTGASPFYCSFVEKKILAPRSNTTITVAFLARQEGLVNNTLLVHSNVGLSRLKLFGFGEPSPFRVRPLIGGKVSLNSTYSSVIYLYNPFPTSIQLTEVYSSGANLQLELLNQDNKEGEEESFERSVGHWNIPPYEYRPVMKTNFAGKIVSNYTSFIRIHLNSSEETQLVLPVEIEVCSEPGLYSTMNILDFGTIVPSHVNNLLWFNIELFNTDSRNITVASVHFKEDSPSIGIKIAFDGPVLVSPNPSQAVVIGRLYLDTQDIACTENCRGKVIIKAQEMDVKPLELEYVMRPVRGSLHCEESLSGFMWNSFSSSAVNSMFRSFHITNLFDFPIVLNSITSRLPLKVDTADRFSLGKTVLLQPNEVFDLGVTYSRDSSKNSNCSKETVTMLIKTNLTDINIPISFHCNCLRVFVSGSPEPLKGEWDMGVMSSSVSMTTHFVLENFLGKPLNFGASSSWNNDVTIDYFGSMNSRQMPAADAVNSLNKVLPVLSKTSFKTNSSVDHPLHVLDSHHFGLFQVHINSTVEGEHRSKILIASNSGDIELLIKFFVNDGKIVANKALLMKTFPGRVVSTQITIKSFNSVPVRVKRISLETNDKRFKVDIPPGYVIQPGENTDVKVTFDPSAICPPLVCYSSLDIEKEVGHFWLLGHGVYSDTAYIDKELYKLVRNQWMTHSELDLAPTASFRFHTDGFGSFHSEVQAQLHWPRLSNKFALKFPALRVGRKLVKDIVIENPADKPIIVQAVHVANYPNADVLIQMMQSIVFHKQWASSDMDAIEKTILDLNNLSAFGFASSSAQGLKLTDTNRVYEWLGVKPSQESFTMLLAPGARQRLGVVFRPLVERNFTSLLILRNNLTVIEVVVLRGEGGSGLLKIDQSNTRREAIGSVESLKSFSAAEDASLTNSRILFEFPENTLDRLCRDTGSQIDDTARRLAESEHAQGTKEDSLETPKNRFVIRQRLKATNIGKMRLQIRHFFIDSMPCEGYGFQVKNCDALQLQPNQSFDLEMTYSPDFTQTTVKHNLFVLLDDEFTKWQHFELVVNIPANYLSKCLSALPRPAWEAYVGRCLFIITTSLIFLTVFVAYTDATRLVSGFGLPLNDADSNTDEDVQSIDDDDVATTTMNGMNGTLSMNGSIQNGNKPQNGRLKQRKVVRTIQQTARRNRSENIGTNREAKADNKSTCDGEQSRAKLNHQNSSSSENESFENLSNSETSSSNHQSTESLYDILTNSRKNSVEEPQNNSVTANNTNHKDKAPQDNGKRRKNKIDWKKLDVAKPQIKDQSTQSMVFPPIEEFQAMNKTRSATHPGHKSKMEERKKRIVELKPVESIKTVPKKAEQNVKPSRNEMKEPSKNAWNVDKIVTDIWRQPSDLSSDIVRFPTTNPPNKAQDSALSNTWVIGEWSNDCVELPPNRRFNNEPPKLDQIGRGYLGLRFEKNSQPFRMDSSSMGVLPETQQRPSPLSVSNSGWLSSPVQTSLWEENSKFYRASSSSVPFSPVIAPPKSTSPSPTVQQIEQQDKYFQQRSLPPMGPPFADSRLGFENLMNREPLFIENRRRSSRVLPPPGFGNTCSIDSGLSWLPTVPTRPTGLFSRTDGFETNSIWNSADSNLDRWPTRATTTPEPLDNRWRPEPESLFEERPTLDMWSSNDRRQSTSGVMNSTWSFSPLSAEPVHPQSASNADPLRISPNPASPSPSSSSSSNGRNNN